MERNHYEFFSYNRRTAEKGNMIYQGWLQKKR